MLRIGILGAAKIANLAMVMPVHKREDVEIAAVAARDIDKARAFAKEHDVQHALQGYETLIERDDIDLVYNALPPSRHADLSIAALRAGKHVLCEKPFCLNAEEAQAMVDASGETGKTLIEAFHYRYHPAFARLLEIVQSGGLGRALRYDGKFLHPIPSEPGELRYSRKLGGGAMMDLGVYPLHAVRTLEGAEPEIISATGQADSAVSGADRVDIAMEADLRFASGAEAHIACDMSGAVQTSIAMRVECERGVVEMTNFLAPQFGHLIAVTQGNETRTETVDANTTYDHQLEHVVEVLKGGTRPLTGGRDAVANMQAVDRIYQMAGMPIT